MTSTPNRLSVTAWLSGYGALIAGLACTLLSAVLLDGFVGGMLTGAGVVMLCAAAFTFGSRFGPLGTRASSAARADEPHADPAAAEARSWWLPSRDGDR